jgi:hypothetical protein
MPTCGLSHSERLDDGETGLVYDCGMPATVRFKSRDGWGQQYACAEHAAVMGDRLVGWSVEVV